MTLEIKKNTSLTKDFKDMKDLKDFMGDADSDLKEWQARSGVTTSSSSTTSTTMVMERKRVEKSVLTEVSGTVGEDGQFVPDRKITTVDSFNDHHVSTESSISKMGNGESVDTEALGLGINTPMTMMITNSTTPIPSLSVEAVDGNTVNLGSELDTHLELENEIMRNLKKTQESVQNLLNQKRDLFVKMFPNLKNVSASSDLFKTEGNLVTTKEGNVVTTTVKSQRQMASSMSQTFINGVKTSGKCRAMLVYHGPTQGYTVKMQSDQQFEDESSETEDDDSKSFTSTAPSEFGEGESIPLPLFASDAVPKISEKKKLTSDQKAFYVVSEIVETEDRYVKKLELLDQVFRKKVEAENGDYKLLSKDKIDHIFCNMSALYTFHYDHLLPKLLEAHRDWNSQKKISDVFVRLGPQLKLYGEYNSKRKRGAELHREAKKQCNVYKTIVEEVESLDACKGLPLEAHMIEPVQRVPRYELLLQQYSKLLDKDHPDYKDTHEALQIVQEAAKHANDIISKMEEYKAVLRVQQKLGTQIINLVTPTRRLVLTSNITKISANEDLHQPRTIILFNDMLLLCSLPSGGNKGVIGSFIDKIYKIGVAELKLRAVVAADGMQVLEGDRLDVENTFYIRGLTENKQKTIELKAEKCEDKRLWMDTLSSVINDHITRMQSFSKRSSESDSTPNVSGTCPLCSVVLNEIKKERICSSCGVVVCKKCCSKKALDSDRKDDLICLKCYKQIKGDKGSLKNKKQEIDRKPSVDVRPDDKSLMKGYLYLISNYLKQKNSGKWEKLYFVLKEDFVLYSFAGEKDIAARTSLPLAGCQIKFASIKEPFFKGVKDVAKMDKDFLTFKIVHSERVYYVRAEDIESMTGWMAILELASKSHTVGA